MSNSTFYRYIKYILEEINCNRFSIKEMNQFHFIIDSKIKLKWYSIDIKYDADKRKFIINCNNNRLKMKFDRYFVNKRFFVC